MKNTRFSLFWAIAVIALSLFVTSCEQPADPTLLSLKGTWLDSSCGSSYYKIDDTYFKNYGTDTSGNDYEGYEGEDIHIQTVSDTEGRIFIKYTKAYESTTTDPKDNSWKYSGYGNWYRYSTTSPQAGKWYAIHYKNLTEKSVSFSGAYGKKQSADTLDEAIQEFTVQNGYFSYYSECLKVE